MSRGRVRSHVVVLAMALGAGLAPWGVLQGGITPVALGAVGLALIMVVTAALRAERSLPWMCDPIILLWLILAQFCIVGPLSMVIFDFYAFAPQTPSRMAVIIALYALLVAMIFLGYQSRIGSIVAARLPDFRLGRRFPGAWGVAAIAAVSVGGCLLYIYMHGGLRTILGRGYGSVSTMALFQLAFHALIGAALVTGWSVVASPRRRPAGLAFLFALLAFAVVFFGLVVGARKYLFFLYFGLLAVWLLRWGVGSLPKVRAALILALLLGFFAFWGAVRARPVTEIVGASAGDPLAARSDEYHMGYFRSVAEPFEVAGIVVDLFPRQEPYRYGGTLLVTVLGFIPRAIWPGKPVGIGKELTAYTDGVFFDPRSGHSVAPTILGDFYANLGISGILIGGLLLGIVTRAAASYAAAGMVAGRQSNAARVLLPAVFLAALPEVRGDLGAVFAFCVMTGAPIVATLVMFRLDHDVEGVEVSHTEPARAPAAEPA